MNKKILFLLLNAIVLGFSSCSSDDSNDLDSQQNKLIGKWEIVGGGSVKGEGYFDTGNNCKNTYQFNSNKTVDYKSYMTCSDVIEEQGTWEFKDHILVRSFPENVLLVMKDSVVFVSDVKIHLFAIGDKVNYDIYEKVK
ncbi:DUF5004 domain-containing protein [Flavobacterium agrisoli]|uniref:Lipocalin-like protein n=1 Tax=Flavobacterium agrisoli TaxID=2793066 RepID=A0A934PN06_9FLAO|nr:DUF5004 domain-containing protein [Flavobacterium agrisoli]MBK0369814.1 hypothetical protein [Flavobacterium agrisoli]